jgi:hypothetical protein
MKSKSSLEFIVLIEPINENARNKANELNIKLYTFEELKRIGRENLKPPHVSRKKNVQKMQVNKFKSTIL